mmetsp:Transcript_8510/g.20994  ORF Transcript_8510/g.20994 Transcript_8510/m.20994 type:complete len:95 (+) Transcript_8510:76-360(+)
MHVHGHMHRYVHTKYSQAGHLSFGRRTHNGRVLTQASYQPPNHNHALSAVWVLCHSHLNASSPTATHGLTWLSVRGRPSTAMHPVTPAQEDRQH